MKDVRHLSLEMGPGVQIYVPLAQMQDHAGMELVVRSPLPVEPLAAAVGPVLREADPSMPTGQFWTVRSTVDRALSARRFTLAAAGTGAGVALSLESAGGLASLLYGVSAADPWSFAVVVLVLLAAATAAARPIRPFSDPEPYAFAVSPQPDP